MKINKLAIAITFLYNESKLNYLEQITKSHNELATESKTFLVTNTNNPEKLKKIQKFVFSKNYEIITPNIIGHPKLLPWVHRELFKNCIVKDLGFSHFLYTEDDLLITKKNINYWIKNFNNLEPIGCIPGFLRYEVNKNGILVSTDIANSLNINELPKIKIKDGFLVSLPQPYQAMYLLNESQAKELLFTEAGSPNSGCWPIVEKAAQGLTFWNYPNWSNSRHFIGLNNKLEIDPGALIHHLPNTYALKLKDIPGNENYGNLPLKFLIKKEFNIFIFIKRLSLFLLRKIFRINLSVINYARVVKNLNYECQITKISNG